MNKRTAYFICGFAAIAAAAAAYLVFGRTGDDTANRPSSTAAVTNSPAQQPAPALIPTKLEYRNDQYGFSVDLPDSWKGYTIFTDQWEGLASGPTGEAVAERGLLINIRHPEWTETKPRQDIPVMIFTLDQWDALQRDDFHIGAAPIGPSELDRNGKYVFALPARYNYAFPEGYEEVDQIIQDGALRAY